ncbi:hypothetical protein Tco_0014312 [Tanacetum coccineum]
MSADEDSHNKVGCFRLIGYPDWWPRKGGQEKQRPRTEHYTFCGKNGHNEDGWGVMADIRDHRSIISTTHQSARGQSKVEEEGIFIPPSIWVDEVIKEKREDLNGEPNEIEIGHGEPSEEFKDDFEHHTQTEAPSEDQTEVDVGPKGSQDEDNQFGSTEEPTFNSDSNNFVEPTKRNRTRLVYLDDYEVQLPHL